MLITHKRNETAFVEMWVDPDSVVQSKVNQKEKNKYCKIPWTEEPGRLQSMGSQRVRHD